MTAPINRECSVKQDILNDLLQEEVRRQSSSEKENLHTDPPFLNIDVYLQDINPLLVHFITSATQTVRECLRSSPGTGHDTNRQVRQYFILCQLLYCTNPKQPTPMYNLLADVVEVFGGSRQLLRILNRLGCVSSPDTHDRFVAQHAEARCQKSIWDELPNNVFTVTSVDNFDMLQSHSAVYCGDQQRSFHGTTVQLVQPSSKIRIPPTIHPSHSGTQGASTPLQPTIRPPNPGTQDAPIPMTATICPPSLGTQGAPIPMTPTIYHSISGTETA